MSPETALYIAGGALLPILGWGIHITMAMTQQTSQLTKLMTMHDDPERYGFGTSKTNKIIEDNTRAMNALTHYIQWLVKDKTGHDAPPPVEGLSHG